MRIELHNRYAVPAMNIVALLLSLPFALRVKATRSVLAGIGISFLLVFAYYGVYTISVTMARNSAFVPYALVPGAIWFPTVLFGGAGALLFKILK